MTLFSSICRKTHLGFSLATIATLGVGCGINRYRKINSECDKEFDTAVRLDKWLSIKHSIATRLAKDESDKSDPEYNCLSEEISLLKPIVIKTVEKCKNCSKRYFYTRPEMKFHPLPKPPTKS